MIDPITGMALAESLAGITTEMSGLDMARAWQQQGFVDPVDAGYGVDFGVGIGTKGADKPAITGDTTGSITTSSESDPLEAFDAQVAIDPSSVDSTTGAIVEGSDVGVFPYSLLQTYPEVGTEVVKAVVPVAVPIEQATVAISQALGVSMDAAQMEVETKQAFAQSIIDGQDLIYDAARGLVKAWWDGVNILFPRKTVQAVQDAIEELGIGTPGGNENPGIDGLPPVIENTYGYGYGPGPGNAASTTPVATANNVIYHPDVLGDFKFFAINDDIVWCSKTYQSSGAYGFRNGVYASSVSAGSTRYTRDGKHAYYSRITNPPYLPLGAENGSGWSAGSGPAAWVALYGDEVAAGGYPEGTQKSVAEDIYKADTIPSAGGIATSPTTTEDVVPINLPVNPLDTTESTVDPISPTDEETVTDLPVPPIPLPIPETKPSNPDVPLVDPTVIDAAHVDALVEELATTLDPQPPQSTGIIPFPFMPGVPVDPSDPTAGSSYPSIVPSSGSGLIHVYNPTPAEFVAFGQWLWVTYADATIDKIWNNPFDGVIGAFELYATPQVDGRDNIRSGFLVCPTSANLVRQRYIEIDCGTAIVPEFYGNYLDYSPYSQAYIYLPFIGINEVSIDDIVGHAINIRYRVDTYNGSCIAMIYVAKSGYRNICYQFAGNCAVEVPLAGGSQAAIRAGMIQAEAYARAGMQSAMIGAIGSIGSGIAHGGLLGGLGGAVSGLAGIGSAAVQGQAGMEAARVANKSTVQHSGSFGASHGAMGLKIPHIIIRNPIQVKVVNYNQDYGFPAHKRVIIGGCTGYLRVREVNVISAHATDEEKAMIEAMLKNGVYVS